MRGRDFWGFGDRFLGVLVKRAVFWGSAFSGMIFGSIFTKRVEFFLESQFISLKTKTEFLGGFPDFGGRLPVIALKNG